MNYDEMLSLGNVQIAKGALLPIGLFHKKQNGVKYENVLDLRCHLSDSVLFLEDVKRECEENPNLSSPHQLHFVIGETSCGDPKSLSVEKGRFTTFSQLLFDNPSLVGRKGFLDNVIKQVFDAAEYINEKGVYHLCYSPDNVLARVGKFIEWLYSTGDMPLEYKRLVKKATMDNPDDRYCDVGAMRSSLKALKATRSSVTMFIVALVAALCIVGFYFGMMPETNEMEYVKPAPRQSTDDLLDDGFDPVTELGVISGDSLDRMPPEKKKEYEKHVKKSEEIFRKQFEREADRILSKVYNSEYMGASEKNFMASSKKIFAELTEVQQRLAGEANLTNEKSQVIATQIIDKITEEKKKNLVKYGIQKGENE